MEWQIFGVITALIAFVSAIVAPILKLNTTITKLTQIVDTIGKDLSDLTQRNASTHERIFNQLGDHETRITVLEHK